MDGRPYVAEAADPFTGSWSGHNTFYHSEHYLHSGFVDLIITGLVGIRPQAGDTVVVNPLVPDEWPFFALEGVSYHGQNLAVVWDRDGSHFGKGSGLGVYVDGREMARVPGLGRMVAPIPPPRVPQPETRLVNHAVNNDPAFFPHASASSSLPTAPPFYAVDGNRWYHPSPPNRWIAGAVGEAPHWIQVDFGQNRAVSEVELYFLDSETGPAEEVTGEEEGSGFPLNRLQPRTPVLPPRAFQILTWDEATQSWREIPGQERRPSEPSGRRANSVAFQEISTSRVRVVLHPHDGATVGLTELEAWGPTTPLPSAPVAPVENLAWNPGNRPYPRIQASYSSPSGPPEQANDGRIALTRYSRNRWAAQGTPNPEDWLELDFGQSVMVGRVQLFLLADGRDLAAPRSLRLERLTEEGWTEITPTRVDPPRPTPWARNELTFDPVELRRIRVLFQHDLPAVTGITELQVWTPGGSQG